jgi:AcrR family transcriptional regulator
MPTPSATREAILRSAREVFTEVGYTGASMRKIASRAGVTHAAIYRHFTDKSDLLSALAKRDFDELVDEVGRRIETEDAALVRLRSLLLGFIAVCCANPRLYEFLFQILPGLPQGRPESAETAHLAVVSLVSDCVNDGELRGDPEELADLVMIAAHGYVARTLARRGTDIPAPDPAAYVDFVLSAARAGAVL